MDLDVVKAAIYDTFARTGGMPPMDDFARRLGFTPEELRKSFADLRAQRLLVLEPDGETIRMAPPFSGVPTPHVVETELRRYHANCAWDALGIVAALQGSGAISGIVHSRCEESGEP